MVETGKGKLIEERGRGGSSRKETEEEKYNRERLVDETGSTRRDGERETDTGIGREIVIKKIKGREEKFMGSND